VTSRNLNNSQRGFNMSKDKLGRQMITLGETYRLRSDRYQWILEERREGFNKKTQEVVENWHQSYYPTISQVALRIVNSEAEQAKSLEEMSQRIEAVSEALANNINVVLATAVPSAASHEEAKALDEVEEVSA